VIFAIVRLLNLRDTLSSSDPLLSHVRFVMWTQLELVYSFLTAAIPPLIKMSGDLNTGLGKTMIDRCVTDTATGSDELTQSAGYELGEMDNAAAKWAKAERTRSLAGSQEMILGNNSLEELQYDRKHW
jgi:hypothetical protein